MDHTAAIQKFLDEKVAIAKQELKRTFRLKPTGYFFIQYENLNYSNLQLPIENYFESEAHKQHLIYAIHTAWELVKFAQEKTKTRCKLIAVIIISDIHFTTHKGLVPLQGDDLPAGISKPSEDVARRQALMVATGQKEGVKINCFEYFTATHTVVFDKTILDSANVSGGRFSRIWPPGE